MERAPYLIIASCLGLSPFLGSPCQRRQRKPFVFHVQTRRHLLLLAEAVLSMPYCPAAEASLYASRPRQPASSNRAVGNASLQHSTSDRPAFHVQFLWGNLVSLPYIYILCKTAVTNWYNSYASLFMRPKMHRSCLGKPAWHRKVQGVPRKIPFWCALAPHNLTMRPNHAWSASMRFEELAKGDAAAAAESRKAKSYNRLNVAGLLKKPPPAHEWDMPGWTRKKFADSWCCASALVICRNLFFTLKYANA